MDQPLWLQGGSSGLSCLSYPPPALCLSLLATAGTLTTEPGRKEGLEHFQGPPGRTHLVSWCLLWFWGTSLGLSSYQRSDHDEGLGTPWAFTSQLQNKEKNPNFAELIRGFLNSISCCY